MIAGIAGMIVANNAETIESATLFMVCGLMVLLAVLLAAGNDGAERQ